MVLLVFKSGAIYKSLFIFLKMKSSISFALLKLILKYRL